MHDTYIIAYRSTLTACGVAIILVMDTWVYWHLGLMRGMATLPKVCTELLVVKDKVRRPQVRPQVSLGQVHGM